MTGVDGPAARLAEQIVLGNYDEALAEMGMGDTVQAETIRLTLAVVAALDAVPYFDDSRDLLSRLVEARLPRPDPSWSPRFNAAAVGLPTNPTVDTDPTPPHGITRPEERDPMTSMNVSILDNPTAYPAVREVNVGEIARAARAAAICLADHGYWVGEIEPGDATRYSVMIARSDRAETGYVMASNFGSLYPWRGRPTIHPDYAREHYVTNDNPWTATVYALFLNMVAEALEAGR